ncbi:MAG TPA: MogA/MoaB family molybdenum cofactor biosynthesis protein [bacterium]|nr:MogA/MoaB family molybdenum cofactor biosynthesis protein [bacterium]
MRVGVLTISDRGARGEREDGNYQTIREMMTGIGAQMAHYEVIPDEKGVIRDRLIALADDLHLDLVLTNGGTGLAPRDVTPDATLEVIDKEVPGMAEAMRLEGLKKLPLAMISRAVAGIRGRTLIINLPGSPKGVRENLAVVLPALPHAIDKLRGSEEDCGPLQR